MFSTRKNTNQLLKSSKHFILFAKNCLAYKTIILDSNTFTNLCLVITSTLYVPTTLNCFLSCPCKYLFVCNKVCYDFVTI